jgi:hypothetical protein
MVPRTVVVCDCRVCGLEEGRLRLVADARRITTEGQWVVLVGERESSPRTNRIYIKCRCFGLSWDPVRLIGFHGFRLYGFFKASETIKART